MLRGRPGAARRPDRPTGWPRTVAATCRPSPPRTPTSRNGLVVHALRAHQHDPRPQRQRLRRPPLSLVIGHGQTPSAARSRHTPGPRPNERIPWRRTLAIVHRSGVTLGQTQPVECQSGTLGSNACSKMRSRFGTGCRAGRPAGPGRGQRAPPPVSCGQCWMLPNGCARPGRPCWPAGWRRPTARRRPGPRPPPNTLSSQQGRDVHRGGDGCAGHLGAAAQAPAVEQALRRGELSAAQAAVVSAAAAADPAAEARLVELASRASVPELREECARVKAAADRTRRRPTGGCINAGGCAAG